MAQKNRENYGVGRGYESSLCLAGALWSPQLTEEEEGSTPLLGWSSPSAE